MLGPRDATGNAYLLRMVRLDEAILDERDMGGAYRIHQYTVKHLFHEPAACFTMSVSRSQTTEANQNAAANLALLAA